MGKYYPARNHEAGAGEWCVRHTDVENQQIITAGKTQAYLLAGLFNEEDVKELIEIIKGSLGYYLDNPHLNHSNEDDLPRGDPIIETYKHMSDNSRFA